MLFSKWHSLEGDTFKISPGSYFSRPINKSIRPASAHCRIPESHLWILMVQLQWKTFDLVYRFSVLWKESQLQLNLSVFPIHYYGVSLQYPTCSICSDLLCTGNRFIKGWLLNPFKKTALTLLPWKGLCAQGRWHVPHWSHPWRWPNRYQQLTKKTPLSFPATTKSHKPLTQHEYFWNELKHDANKHSP